MESKYILADLQDLEGDNREETLEGAKEFLTNHWVEDLEDNDPFFKEIEDADFKELNEMLAGIDYELFTEEGYQYTLSENVI